MIWDFSTEFEAFINHMWALDDSDERLDHFLMEEYDPFERLPLVSKRKWEKLVQFLLPINPNRKHLGFLPDSWDDMDTSDFDDWEAEAAVKLRQLMMIHAIERQKVAMFQWMVKREVFMDEWRGYKGARGVFWHLVSNMLEIGNVWRSDTDQESLVSLSRAEGSDAEYWATSRETFENSIKNYEAMIKILIDNGCNFTKDPAVMLSIIDLVFEPMGSLERYFAEGKGIELSGSERVHRAERILTAIFLPILQIPGTSIPTVKHEETKIIPPLHWVLQKWSVLSPDFREEFIFGLLFAGADVNQRISLAAEDLLGHTSSSLHDTITPIMRVVLSSRGILCVPNLDDQIWLLRVLIEFGADIEAYCPRQKSIFIKHLLQTDKLLCNVVVRARYKTLDGFYEWKAMKEYERLEREARQFSTVSIDGLYDWENSPSAADELQVAQDARDLRQLH